MKILLISGHGAGDSGACATIDGVLYKEADEAIVMVRKIEERLKAYDVEVDVYPIERNAYEDARAGCLRVDLSLYDYVLEIHFNACVNDLKGNGRVTGSEAFVTTSDKTMDVEKRILSELKELGFTNRGIKSHNWTVINRAKTKGADSFLLEICFIDDRDDMLLYVSNRDGIADGIVAGMVYGLGLAKKVTIDYGPVFDAQYYAKKNPDVRKSYGTDKSKLLQHFIKYGMKEGRLSHPDFNVKKYKKRYKDLQKAFGDDYQKYYMHYLNYGIKEGRKGK